MWWEDLEFVLKNKRHFFWLSVIRASRLAHRIVPKPVRRIAFDTLASISPDVPTDLQRFAREDHGWRVFTYGYAGGLILCLGITWSLTIVFQVWQGTDPERVYLSQDWANLVLYTLVCPIYVGLCCCLIVLFLRRSTRVGQFADQISGEKRFRWLARFPVALMAIISITALILCKYIVDILKIANVPHAYWFMTKPIDGVRYLNEVGIYYVVLNFSLLFLTVTTIFCFFSMFFDTVRIGHGLHKLTRGGVVDQEIIESKLLSFTEAYLLAKLLCASTS